MQDDEPTYLTSATPKNKLIAEEGPGLIADPLQLNIEDKELVRIIDKRIKDYRLFYGSEKYNLFDRRKKNELYYFGRQVAELEKAGRIKDYQAKNLDNAIYEIEATIKPLAMSQMPDLIVTPGNNSDQAKQTAKILSQAVDTDVKRRNNRQVLGLAFKHRPVYYVGVIKAIWNPQLAGGLGDYEFQTIHPDLIEFDHTAPGADVNKMSFVSQICPMPIKDVIMKYPSARQKFIEELQHQGIKGFDTEEPSWRAMATVVKIREVWFTDYKKLEDGKWQRIEGVMWKYGNCILGKMKNPHYDYKGEKQVFTYENPAIESSRRPMSLPEMQTALATNVFPENVKELQVYHNYFQMPQKPYYFMVYDQWGKQPLDETSSIEQNIKNQEALDNITRTVQEKLANRGHHIWSKMSGLKPADIEKMDHNNPDEDYLVDGKVGEVHLFVPGEQPTQQEFAEKKNILDRMFSLAGSNAVRGTVLSDTATTNQIARESNYTRADDLVDETINPAAEWMASWALQFIKLRYTKEHFRKILGSKGEVAFVRLHQNLVEEGMEVMIKASGTDKIKAQNNAIRMIQLQVTDPLSFFQDMNLSDPEDRTLRLMLFQKDPMNYIKEYLQNNPEVTQDFIARLAALPIPPAGTPGASAGPAVTPPQANPGPANTAQVPAAPPTGPIQGNPQNILT